MVFQSIVELLKLLFNILKVLLLVLQTFQSQMVQELVNLIPSKSPSCDSSVEIHAGCVLKAKVSITCDYFFERLLIPVVCWVRVVQIPQNPVQLYR